MANRRAMADALPASALSSGAPRAQSSRLRGFGFALLGYTVFVLLLGALVRVTGSGAGCGQHWPTCQGELVLMPKTFHTALEYSHRLTSGLVLGAGIAYALVLRRKLSRGHRASRAMLLGLAFTLIDAAIGAWLVLGALVGQNASAARAMVMPAHLVSTCGLTAGFALAAYWANEPGSREGAAPPAARRWPLLACLGAFVVVAAMGAVTALGDTLYPIKSTGLALGGAHFLEQLRIVHPLLAVVFGVAVAGVVPRLVQGKSRAAQRFARWAVGAVFVELAAGLLNVLLSAPAWMQIVHLALAIALWLALVLTTAEALAPSAAR